MKNRSNPSTPAENLSAHERKLLLCQWRRASTFHSLGVFLRVLLTLVLALLIVLYTAFLGPSVTVCEKLTNSLMESSALKFVPYLFLRDEQVDDIIARGQPKEPEAVVNTSLIQIAKPEDANEEADETEEEAIALYPVSGSTYKGYVMIVKDPSRVFLGVTSPQFNNRGMSIDVLAEKYGAVGGINASGFEDEGGVGDGGQPLGMVISEGEILRSDSSKTIAAFDKNDILHVGKFTKEEAQALGLRDGAGWGPALVINGEPAEITSTSTGLNPRTAIGQRADGAVIMVVLDGRHPSCLGGTYMDLIEILMRFGAVNACNLDGGYSSIMYYEGRRVSDVTSMDRSRKIPTAFLIREVTEE